MASKPQPLGWIWPKDPRPGNPSSWPRHWRFLDVLTNKGPDIYVGTISNKSSAKTKSSSTKLNRRSSESRSTSSCSFYTSESEPVPARAPQKTNWDRWDTPSDSPKCQTQVPWAKRKSNERYDFRQRKYTVPDLGTWSRVEYCTLRKKGGWVRFGKKEKHCVPRRYWDQNGKEYPANYWHDIIYGEHEDEIHE